MGKYEKLGRHLRERGLDYDELTFSEIEGVLGFPLPKSASEHRPWWANDQHHVQAQDGWISSGYQTKSVDIANRKVGFRKTGEPEEHHGLREITGSEMGPIDFERLAQIMMSQCFGVNLSPRRMEDWPKLFDMVSDDYKIVGDAKYLSMVKGQYLPPAKLSVIAEHVWMLEKTGADVKFLTFGNDRRVPEEWLKRYSQYVDSVSFYFLSNDGELYVLLNKSS